MESHIPPKASHPYFPRAALHLSLLAAMFCTPAQASPGAPAPAPPAPAAPAPPDAPALYQRACQSCHGPEGKGQPGLYPPLASSDWVNAPSPARLIRLTLHGVSGPIAINGKPFPTATPFMPGHAATLNDNEIATLLTWLRRSMGNHAPPVTPDQITPIRTAEANRTALWTTAELLKIPAQ